MSLLFEIAAGSVIGSKNNQDSFSYYQDETTLIAVVCDGCSEGRYSEVGARLGSSILVQSLKSSLPCWSIPSALESSRMEVIRSLRALASIMDSNSPSSLVNDYFLFTSVGVIIYKGRVIVFSLGDGIYYLNSGKTILGPFPGNSPPYLAYSGLVKSSLSNDILSFKIHEDIPAYFVDSVLIGTDGVLNLVDSANLCIPGKTETVGDISQFWIDDRYFSNKDMVRRKLFLANRESTKPNWEEKRLVTEKGLLPDDTTLVVIRRRN